VLVAVCGLAGAGKTTTVDLLERLGRGVRVYVGAFVTAEVERRGLPASPGNEREVREDLRKQGGMDALARLALPTIRAIVSTGRVPLIDAIYCVEEYDLYKVSLDDAIVRLAITATKSERVQRLAARGLRPINADELTKRDAFEFDQLGLRAVISAAEHTIDNDGTLNDLEASLKRLQIGGTR